MWDCSQFIVKCKMEKLFKCLLLVVFASVVIFPARSQNAESFTFGDESSELSHNLNSRIVFGTLAAKDQFPFYAYLTIILEKYGTRLCGGSLISPNFLLTAAHCVTDAYRIFIEMGSIDRAVFPDFRIASTISIHPDYNFNLSKTNNDIAIIKFNDPLNYKTIGLPTSNSTVNYEEAKMIAIGFGRDENGRLPKYLSYTKTIGFSNEQCKLVYGIRYKSDIILCGKGAGISSICAGDSGGPLVLDNVLVGVSSFVQNASSCIDDVAGFTRVTHFLEWINNQMSTL